MSVIDSATSRTVSAAPAVRSKRWAVASGRIPGLDGLRAVAVLAVVAYHLWPEWFPGGFVGVDLFFVISGFLITTLLLRERRSAGRIAFGAFWLRRARRLLPPLVTVVVVSVAAARLVDADLLVGAPRQVLGALSFSTNWVEVAAGADYFDNSTPTLFMTFWSLAVEEQFYALWPVVFALVAAARIRSDVMARVAAGVALGSALLMAVQVLRGSTATRVYYGTDTHLFGLMIGVSLAFGFAGGYRVLAAPRWRRLRIWVGFVGLATVAVLVTALHGESSATYPLGLLVASGAGGLMVAALPGQAIAYRRWTRWRVLDWAGSRSYGLYLWHWPVILIVTQLISPGRPGEGVPPVTALVSLAVTSALTELTFRFVETPIRRDGLVVSLRGLHTALVERADDGRRRLAAPMGAAAAGMTVLVAAVGLLTVPDRSEAESAVDAGLAAIAAQPEPSSVTAVPVVGSSPQNPPESTTTTVPSGPAWPTDQPIPSGELITGVGDSVMSGAAPALYERFPGIYLDAKPIRQWKAAPEVVDRLIRQGRMRRVVVINFGTNAGLVEEHSRAALRKVLDTLGPNRRVVLFDTVGVSRWVPSSNDTLRSIAAGYPNVGVADWNMVVHSFPNLLHRDRTHPNMAGIGAYAELLSQTLAALGPG